MVQMEAHECRILVEPPGSCSLLDPSADLCQVFQSQSCLPANSHSSLPLHSAVHAFASQNDGGLSSVSCCSSVRAGGVKVAHLEEAGGSVLGGCSLDVNELTENCLEVPLSDTASAQILQQRFVIPLELQGSGCVESVDCQGDSSFHKNDPVPATQSHTCSSPSDVDLGKVCKASVAEKKRVGMDGDSDKICRVCHFSVAQEQDCDEVIELGCACKNDLAMAHRQCAEEWFKVKGNRWQAKLLEERQ